MKRSKKVLSRGRSEKRATGAHPSDATGLVTRHDRHCCGRWAGQVLRGTCGMPCHQLLLGVAHFPVWLAPGPGALGVELPGVGVVGEAALEHLEQLRLQ